MARFHDLPPEILTRIFRNMLMPEPFRYRDGSHSKYRTTIDCYTSVQRGLPGDAATLARLSSLCRSVHPIIDRLLFTTVYLGQLRDSQRQHFPLKEHQQFSVRKFARLYAAVKCRKAVGQSVTCHRLIINFGSLVTVAHQALDPLIQELIFELHPSELYVACGSPSAIDLRPVSLHTPLATQRLSVYLYNGEDLGTLAAILRLCSHSIEHLELMLRDESETEKVTPKTPAPPIGFGIFALPKLKKLFMWQQWPQHQFKKGEKSTIMNLMEAIPVDCNFQMVHDQSNWDLNKSNPPWHKRLQANKHALMKKRERIR